MKYQRERKKKHHPFKIPRNKPNQGGERSTS